MTDCTFPRCGCSEREQCRPEKQPVAAIDLTQFDGHTPGPWKAHEKGAHTHRFVTGMTEASDFPGDKFLVAYAVGMDSEPNARLIAAAPDLLAAYKAALARAEAAEAEVKRLKDELRIKASVSDGYRDQRDTAIRLYNEACTKTEDAERQRDEALTAGAEAMREACAAAIEKRAVEIGRQECCGFGLSSPPECCADPLWMISSQDGAAAIRALPIPAQEVK